MTVKRLHPFLMVYDFWKLVKSNFFLAILLYVVNFGSERLFMQILQVAFLAYIVIRCVSIVIKWSTLRYEIRGGSIHIREGLLSKSYRTVPLDRIQNVQRHTPFLYKWFGVTSITFETAMAGDDSSVTLEAVSLAEAQRLEQWAADQKPDLPDIEDTERTLHFSPTRKDLLKASFTSFSFLAIIPVVLGLYESLNDLVDWDEAAEGVARAMQTSTWLIPLLIVLIIVISVAFGIVRTFAKYGNYEITSDEDKVYIRKGVLEETAFSISKDRVQAVLLTQSLLKKMLGLAEVKLVSSGGAGEEEWKANSLYPFLPVKRAYSIIEEILPDYKIASQLEKLDRQALCLRMLRPSWLWMLATAALLLIRPSLWHLSFALLALILALRLIDVRNSGYLLRGEFLQLRSGALVSSMVLTKRSKIIEVSVVQSRLQQRFGLATVAIANRSDPVLVTTLKDVPARVAGQLYAWYWERTNVIEVEQA